MLRLQSVHFSIYAVRFLWPFLKLTTDGIADMPTMIEMLSLQTFGLNLAYTKHIAWTAGSVRSCVRQNASFATIVVMLDCQGVCRFEWFSVVASKLLTFLTIRVQGSISTADRFSHCL